MRPVLGRSNMNKTQEIKEAIRTIAGKTVGSGLFLVGTVKSVEGESCTVAVGELELDEVRLTAANDGADGKMLVTPAVGSTVLLTDLSGGTLRDLAVVAFTKVDKIEATCSQITLNGGENGGLVNIEHLKQWMGNVESDLAVLKTLLQTSPIAGNGAPAAIVFSPRTQSVANNIEDNKITH